ncbi:MAG: hypothetical protein M1358_15915, partial [Chloroflexi bacterium]|nr:hypothetical protein [Chloroflexota bacterium]
MRAHPGMAVVAAIYLALAVLYSLVTPIFEAPDELWHFLVIRQIVDHRSLPVQVKPPENSLSRQEASQPPLYYMMAAAILAPEAIKGGRAVTGVDDVAHVNPDGRPGDTQATENRNIVFHSPDEGFPYSGTALRIHFLRLLSIAMGLVTIVATYALALDLATGWHQHPRALALGAAALNAAIPQFLFIVSSVNNDNLATMLSSLTLLAMVRFYQSSTISSPSVHRSLTLPLGRTEPSALTGITSGDAPKPPLPEGERAGVRGDAHEKTSQSTSEAHPFSALTRSNPVKPTVFPAKPYIYLGLLMGALALSKLSALTLLPLILVTVLVSIPRRQWASTVKPASWFVVTFALVAGWWYLRN